MASRPKYYELEDIDEVERLREVRRQIQQQHPTTEEFDRWLMGLQRQHNRRLRQRAKKSSRVGL